MEGKSLGKVWVGWGRLQMTLNLTWPLFTRNEQSVVWSREWYVAFRTLISKLDAGLTEVKWAWGHGDQLQALSGDSKQDNSDHT